MARMLALLPICLLLHDQQARLHNLAMPCPPERAVANAPSEQSVEDILISEPLAFLQLSLQRCEREVHGYSCLLHKTERVSGVLRTTEEVIVHFKENPHSVYMHWQKGAGKAAKVLYVKGANDDHLLAVPAGLLGVLGIFARSLDHPDSRNSGRYLISDFGIRIATQRTVLGWQKAHADGALHVRYEGIFAVPQLGSRRCYKLVRRVDPPEAEGLAEGIFYFDVENWLQTGSILRDTKGDLIAEYFFRDLMLNPSFFPGQFTRSAL